MSNVTDNTRSDVILRGPDGKNVSTLEAEGSGDDAFRMSDIASATDYYKKNGYVVIKGMIAGSECEKIKSIFLDRIKGYPGHLFRQTASGLAEVNRFNERGHLMNSLLNIHDLPRNRFADFRSSALDIFCCESMRSAVRSLFGEPGVLVQSMYFEGNPATWAHQDTYYLDSSELGRLAAAWIALEDIAPGAGRFYVYPQSHLYKAEESTRNLNFSFNHEEYKKYIIDIINENGWKLCSPFLRAGDVLFWNSRTIHGSLETVQPEKTRNSLTAHYIPESMGFIQFQSRLRKMHLENHNGLKVHHPKDLDRISNRFPLWLQSRFPLSYKAARKVAIKYFTR